MRIKQYILMFALALSVGFGSSLALGQEAPGDETGTSGPTPGVAGQSVICRGDRDWGTFISAALSYDDFVEYWDDILVKYNTNICHYTDIDNLLNRLNKVRKQIRNAFYACANTEQLKKTYYELEAELFFLRKYVNADNGNFLVVDDEKLLKEMRDYFVINKGFFSDADIRTLFDRFKNRYEARLDTYKNCSDPTWAELVAKWNQFRETAGGIAPAVQQAGESFEKRWDRVERTPWRRGGDYYLGFIDARVNGLPAEEGLDQIGNYLEEQLPEGYTFSQLQAAKELSDQNVNYLDMEATYLAQYQAQYGEASDTFVRRVVERMSLLQDIIEKTVPFQNQTIQCTKTINNKQC
ncbi:MAG TPA: hypothetical protein PKA32_01090 [Candidatus Gracilibacteria bacterium]|nr:hypothetical protein [Candidatus Gracilibacteria bacterium]